MLKRLPRLRLAAVVVMSVLFSSAVASVPGQTPAPARQVSSADRVEALPAALRERGHAALEVLRVRATTPLLALLERRLTEVRAAGDTAQVRRLAAEQERWVTIARGSLLPTFMQQPPPMFAAARADKQVRVLAFGDFGDGSEAQRNVAVAMRRFHSRKPFDFALTLGDNFYSTGMSSPEDARWKTWWADLYDPLRIPFYATLGNHDWGQPNSPAAEIVHTSRSRSWRMPAAYYTFTAGPAQFFALDTDVISEKQIEWLTEALDASHARWKIVYGHHPIYSEGQHEDNNAKIAQLLPVLKNRADIYLAGHDHDMQHLKPEGRLHFFVAGTGGKLRPIQPGPRSLFARSANGFAVLEIEPERLQVVFIDTAGVELYRYALTGVHPAMTQNAPPPAAQPTPPSTRPTPPTRDPNTPGYVTAKELPDGAVPPPDADGNFIIGPTHNPAPEMAVHEGVPQGTIYNFTMSSADSKIYPGIAREAGTFGTVDAADPAKLVVTTSHPAAYTRKLAVYVPKQYVPGTPAPFIVGADGPDQALFAALDNLIDQKRVPVMIAISIGNGSGDAQGSQRGLEYDTMSGRYAEFVETEVLPLVEKQYSVKLTKDPDGRATMGGSSGGSAALIMAWYHPELYHRVLAYSITAVNQQWPPSVETPHGAWEFHERLIPNSPVKPIRIWMEVGDRDLFNPNVMRDNMHDWVVASENMAKVLAAKGYHYQFVFARNAGHTDRTVKQQTLPEALEWLWRGYPVEGAKRPR